ncbi:MAG: glycoside hydrolase family 28 protein [Muribaculaceae bacterium]|nr:glycoside hydrolase family 28 protein [Muribaculaceae bacterium]
MNLKFLLSAVLFAGAMSAGAASTYEHLYEGLPFDMPVIDRPAFKADTLSIADCGAVGDGLTLNSEAFAKAIDTLSSRGGGVVLVPSGVWLTGPIELKSNINLHLDGGALIVFAPDETLYKTVYVVYEGFEAWRTQSPVSGVNLQNVAITGEGVIDGSGGMWRPVKKDKMNTAEWNNLTAKGGVVKGTTWYPSQNYLDGEVAAHGDRRALLTQEEASRIKRFLRPVMIQLVGCKNVLLEGVTFQNSPAWNIHPLLCENLIVDGVFIKNPDFAQNGDGLDVESCKNVIVYRSTLDVGDDAICLKSGKDEAGRKRGVPTENVIVKDCRVFHGHGGFVVGSEMSGGVNNVSVKDCQFMGTDIGLRFKSTRGRGGVVKNIFIDNINMLGISGDAITFDLYYFVKNAPTVVPPVDETTPQFKDIFINKVTSYDSGKALKFNGIPEMPIENIQVTNSVFTAREGGLLSESMKIRFDNVTVRPASGPAMTINNVKDAVFTGCSFVSPEGESVVYTGDNKDIKM